MGRRVALALGALAIAGCGQAAVPKTPDVPKPIEGHLLLLPQADAESLLGREVTLTDRGGYRIAEARAPGCEVLVKRSKAQYRAVRDTQTSQLASIGAGYQQLLALEAKYGHQSHARLELENSEVLEGDLRGPCGRTVIAKLFVGHGSRRVFAASQAQGGASVTTPLGTIGPKGESSAQDVEEVSWKDDQAYAFDVRDLGGVPSSPLAVDVKLPSLVTEGDELHVTFASERETWLVVYYVDAENKAEVLWPSNEEPAPSVRPGKTLVLPSPGEQAAGIKIRPSLAKAGVAAREQLVVYAFADKRDFDIVKPPSGSSSAAGVAFTEELAKKLHDVPASRWSRQVLGYTITPKR